MTPNDVERTADLIAGARSSAKAVTLEGALAPQTIEDAYAVQALLAKKAGGVAGWKIAGIVPAQREKLGIERPIAGPVLNGLKYDSPARFAVAKFIIVIIEGEFDFILGRDLPARSKPYTETEVADAVAELRPAIELVDSRVGRSSPTLVKLADCFSNGALVLGAARKDWRGLDLLNHEVKLRIDGQVLATGTGSTVPGGPLAALVSLANNPPAWSGGLKAGQAVTTGAAALTQQLPPGPHEVVAEFGALGEVKVSLTA
jgi:2-keto-4-pentenoate hydratase